jgi:hypothetical protein
MDDSLLAIRPLLIKNKDYSFKTKTYRSGNPVYLANILPIKQKNLDLITAQRPQEEITNELREYFKDKHALNASSYTSFSRNLIISPFGKTQIAIKSVKSNDPFSN